MSHHTVVAALRWTHAGLSRRSALAPTALLRSPTPRAASQMLYNSVHPLWAFIPMYCENPLSPIRRHFFLSSEYHSLLPSSTNSMPPSRPPKPMHIHKSHRDVWVLHVDFIYDEYTDKGSSYHERRHDKGKSNKNDEGDSPALPIFPDNPTSIAARPTASRLPLPIRPSAPPHNEETGPVPASAEQTPAGAQEFNVPQSVPAAALPAHAQAPAGPPINVHAPAPGFVRPRALAAPLPLENSLILTGTNLNTHFAILKSVLPAEGVEWPMGPQDERWGEALEVFERMCRFATKEQVIQLLQGVLAPPEVRFFGHSRPTVGMSTIIESPLDACKRAAGGHCGVDLLDGLIGIESALKRFSRRMATKVKTHHECLSRLGHDWETALFIHCTLWNILLNPVSPFENS